LRLARIGPELWLIFRIGTQTETRIFFKNGFTITFKCGTRIEMVLIYFSEPELEVQHRSKEPANNDLYFIGRGLKVPKFFGLAY